MQTPKILVRDYMKSVTVFFSPTSNLEQVVDQLTRHNLMGAPVLDEHSRMLGFITQRDCLEQLLNDSYYSQDHQIAADIMSKEPVSVSPDMDIMHLAEDMVAHHPKLYPVCEEGHVVGIITRTEVLKALSAIRMTSENRI